MSCALDILVAEDNSTNRKYMDALLRRLGHNTRFAEDGEQAVTLVNQRLPDLVLMDLHMPVMDGIQATETLRAAGGKAAEVPVVGLSADAFEEARQRCLAAGMEAYFTKPLDASALERWLIQRFPHGGLCGVALTAAELPPPEPPGRVPGDARTVLPASATARRFRAGEITECLSMDQLGEVCLVMTREGLHRMIDEFADVGRGNLAALMRGLAQGGDARVRALAHSVKGESASMGMQALSQVAQQIEKHDGPWTAEHCDEALRQLTEVWESTCSLFDRLGFLPPSPSAAVPAERPVAGNAAPLPVPEQSDPEQDLMRIAYVSRLVVSDAQTLASIHESSVRNNHRHHITGMLLVSGDRVIQVLEGKTKDVINTFALIEVDPRHEQVERVADEKIQVRSCTDWSMGYCIPDAPARAGHVSESAFFGDRRMPLSLMVQPGPVLDLLRRFNDGHLPSLGSVFRSHSD